MKCLFCEIILGKLKCYRIYEDQDVMAFLDINPASTGHTLVVPKEHYKDIYEIPEEKLVMVMKAAKKISQSYRKLGIKSVNIMNSNGRAAQQSIFHFHVHVVPRSKNDRLNLWY